MKLFKGFISILLIINSIGITVYADEKDTQSIQTEIVHEISIDNSKDGYATINFGLTKADDVKEIKFASWPEEIGTDFAIEEKVIIGEKSSITISSSEHSDIYGKYNGKFIISYTNDEIDEIPIYFEINKTTTSGDNAVKEKTTIADDKNSDSVQNNLIQEDIVNMASESFQIDSVEVVKGEFNYTINISTTGGQLDRASFPTWTSKNGQDDIVWGAGTVTDNKVSFVVDMKDHGYEEGTYESHVYVYDIKGHSAFAIVPIQTMRKKNPTISNLQVENKGTSYVITADVKGMDIKKVLFPTWTSKNGQDDLMWGNGIISDNKVSYTVDIKDFGYEDGQYESHLYAYDAAGQMTAVAIPYQILKKTPLRISNVRTVNNGTSYSITADVEGMNVQTATFPTWTNRNGQDDIVWGKGNVSGNKISYTVDMQQHNYEDGEYVSHIYVHDSAGQGAIAVVPTQRLTKEKLAINNIQVENLGTSYIITADIQGKDIKYVSIPTWTSYNGQDDIIWGEGVVSANKVRFTVNAKDHNFEAGLYESHIYAYDETGQMAVAIVPKQTMKKEAVSISNVQIKNIGSSYTITADINGMNAKQVSFPTWTSRNGQDDIVWGVGDISGNKVSYTVDVKDHGFEEGEYQAHIYAYGLNGEFASAIVTAQTLTVASPKISDVKTTMFKGQYIIECTVDGYVNAVSFPTWTTKNGQDDISWETGTIIGNKVTYAVDYKNHGYELGEYQTHIYAYGANGKVSSYPIEKQNMNAGYPTIGNVKISDVSSTGYLVSCTVYGEYDLSSANVVSWTQKNDQDDVQWKAGVLNGNTITYRVNVKDHGYEFGDYLTHIYAYDKAGNMLMTIAPTVSIGGTSLPGWTIQNGHKYLYDANGVSVGNSGMMIIDVSYANGNINWEAVRNSGVDGVILRSSYGYSFNDNGQAEFSQMDEQFRKNVSELNRLNIPYGIYHFTYARNEGEGALEAKYLLECLKEAGARPSLPIYYDLESSSYVGEKSNGFYTRITRDFANVISTAGYQVGVYANYNWWNTKLTDSSFNSYVKWVAHYGSDANNSAGTANPYWHPNSNYKMWQYSSCGTVSGISGRVDMNILFNW